MQERVGHLFSSYDSTPGSWLVVTTNGSVDGEGSLVMTMGIAGAAKRHFPGIERALGTLVRSHGNVPVVLPKVRVLTWPTKPGLHTMRDGRVHAGWMCISRVDEEECKTMVGRLTAASGLKLLALVESQKIAGPIFLPRPNCGIGGLEWQKVRPWMQERFDDRFVVVDPAR